jgi:hypothetical protein
MTAIQRSLVTGLDIDGVEEVRSCLAPLHTWLDESPWDESVGERLRTVRYDLLVVGYPVPGPPALGHLLHQVRHRESASFRCGAILVADDVAVDGGQAFVGRGVNRVVSVGEVDDVLAGEARRLLSVAPRYPVRAPAHVVVHTRPSARRAFCQTENLSTTGVLLRGFGHYPLGAKIEFEISLPGETEPIRGAAEVCRTTNFARERLEGFGATFTDFQGDDGQRLEQYLSASDE